MLWKLHYVLSHFIITVEDYYMPVYEFKCKHCNAVFSELRKIGDTKAPECPNCHSDDTEKIFSVFSSGAGAKPSCASSSGGG